MRVFQTFSHRFYFLAKMYNTKTLVIGAIPIGLLAITHLKSLPLVYTIRAWLLLRSLIRKAKVNQLRPDRKRTLHFIAYILFILLQIYLALFSTVIQEHRCYLDDIDYNQHMVSYFFYIILFSQSFIEQ